MRVYATGLATFTRCSPLMIFPSAARCQWWGGPYLSANCCPAGT